MSMPFRSIAMRLSAAAAALLAAGCANNAYLDAKSNTAAGGRQEQQIAAANTQLASAQTQNTQLKTAAYNREQEIARNDARIRTLEGDLKKQDAALSAALKSKKLTQARYTQLKRDLDAIQAEAQNADLQNQAARMDKNPSASGDAAKQAKLQELEQRKKALEATLVELSK